MPSNSHHSSVVPALPLGAQFLEPDDEILEHSIKWSLPIWSAPPLPAEMIRIPDTLGEPSVSIPFQQSSQRHPAPAPDFPEFRWSASPEHWIVNGTLPALPQPLTPHEACRLAAMIENLRDFPKQLEAIRESEYAQFIREHCAPLSPPRGFESQDPHSPTIT